MQHDVLDNLKAVDLLNLECGFGTLDQQIGGLTSVRAGSHGSQVLSPKSDIDCTY